jgi:hypothetical protein
VVLPDPAPPGGNVDDAGSPLPPLDAGAPSDAQPPPSPTDAGAGNNPIPDPVGPTPPASWQPVTANLAGMSSECGNMDGVYPSPSSDMLIAGVARQGLWKSTDGAVSWQRIGTSGDKILNRTSMIVFDPDHPGTFWESGIYGFESPFTDGVFVTSDNGASFHGYGQLAQIQSHNDSVSIDFSDPQRKTHRCGRQ